MLRTETEIGERRSESEALKNAIEVICKVAINADGDNKEKPPKHWTALPLMVGTSTILNAANATAIASREFDSDLRFFQ
ncbi:hypothetical protein A2U01_0063369, partial [Trifolium medium]|nr:hypothetical protein [Trifolium medium]